jgi:CRP-like cAMP-binding protein
MISKFLKYFSKMTLLSDEEAKAISGAMTARSFGKGTILLKEGQRAVDTYFVLEGCIREYIVVDGAEKTTNFFTEDQWVISLNNFSPQSRAAYNLVCVDDTTLVVSNEQEAQEMFKQFPRFETISREIMETYFAEQKKLLTSFLADSPEQRYLKLLESKPDLIQRVPLYQLASYIGVKPESLSRIRKRVLQKRGNTP